MKYPTKQYPHEWHKDVYVWDSQGQVYRMFTAKLVWKDNPVWQFKEWQLVHVYLPIGECDGGESVIQCALDKERDRYLRKGWTLVYRR